MAFMAPQVETNSYGCDRYGHPYKPNKALDCAQSDLQVAEDSHMTLKEYFDAADQRRERERQKKTQCLGCQHSTRQCSVACNFTLDLLGTNISPFKGILKMIFLFHRWDMFVPCRVFF